MSLVALALPLAAMAQSQTGSIVFEVAGPDGQPVAGATITLSSDNLQGTQLRETDERGRARFTLLPPGDYFAEVLADRFLTRRIELSVAVGTARVEPVALVSGAIEETVTVTATDERMTEVDPTETGTRQTFTREFLRNAQVGAGRGYQTVLQQAAGTGGDDNPSVHGSTGAENRYMIDGVDITDPVTGTWGLDLNYDALEQVEFSTAGFQAEYGQATGGVVNVITRSGSNEVAGTVDVRYSDERFQETGKGVEESLPGDDRLVDFTLGGPIVKDKLWYFVALSHTETAASVSNSPHVREFEGQRHLGKLTWQVNPDHRVALQYTADPAEISNWNASHLVAQEAGAHQDQGGHFWKLTHWGRLTDLWSMNAQLATFTGTLDGYPENNLTDVPRIDLISNIQSGNYSDAQFSTRKRDQLALQFERISTGQRWHDVKFGVDVQKTAFEFERRQPGGRTDYVAEAAFPGEVIAQEVVIEAGPTENEGLIWAAYVQDTWHVGRRTTFDYGLRWDSATFENDAKQDVVDVAKLQPRLGISFDVRGDAFHVIRGSAARMMHPGILTVPYQANSRANVTETYLDETIFGDCNNDGVMPGLTLCQVTGGPGGSFIDADVEATYMDELTLGYSSQVRPNFTFGVTAVWRETSDIIEDTFRPDVGPNGSYELTNIPGLTRRYRGLEFSAGYDGRRAHVYGSWTVSASKGNIEDTQGVGADFDLLPAHGLNRFGYLSYDRRHRFKVHGWVDLPLRFQVAYDFLWASGLPYDTVEDYVDPTFGNYDVVFLEPRGSHRLPSITELNAEVRKSFAIGNSRLSIIVGADNVLGGSQTTGVEEHVDAVDANGVLIPHGTPQAWQVPRSYELGLRYEFGRNTPDLDPMPIRERRGDFAPPSASPRPTPPAPSAPPQGS